MRTINKPYSPEYTESSFITKEAITEEGVFKGMGTVFDNKPDSGFFGDIIMPGAFHKTIRQGGRNKNGIVMLSQHGMFTMVPPGVWADIQETEKGLPVTGELFVDNSKHAKNGKGTELAHELHVAMSAKALRGLSIGFDFPRNKSGKIKDGVIEFDDNDNRIIKEVILWEISPVTFGMKVNANITSIKSISEATTERELERALKNVGLTRNDSKYLVKLCRDKLREAHGVTNKGMDIILNALKETKTIMKGLNNGQYRV